MSEKEDVGEDALLERFRRKPDDPRPEWAFKSGNVVEEMETVPLFMTRLPDSPSDNPALAALQSLLYEGPSDEVALNFKTQGNEAFKLGPKGYKDATVFYTKGLAEKCPDEGINASLHLNRAAVHLLQKNFGDAVKDAEAALCLDESSPTAVKAHYRAAKALLALNRLAEAESHVKALAELDPPGDEAQKLAADLESKREAERKLEEQRQLHRNTERRLKLTLEARNVKTQRGCEDDLIAQFGASFNATSLPSVHFHHTNPKALLWPVFLLYPPYDQSDFISAFDERDTFADHMGQIFEEPASWDVEGIYKDVGKLDVFLRSADATELVRIRSSHRLSDVVGHLIKTIDRGILLFFVVPRETAYHQRFTAKFTKVVEF